MPRKTQEYVPREPSFPATRVDYADLRKYKNLSLMSGDEKQEVFKKLNESNPKVIAFCRDPFVQMLRDNFGGEICIHNSELGE